MRMPWLDPENSASPLNRENDTSLARWLGVLALLAFHAALLVAFRGRFDHDRELAEYPALWLAAGLVSAGIVFLFLVRMIASSERLDAVRTRTLLIAVIAGGLVLRAMLLWSTPALEDDFYRYLWDGGVTANGYSPYAIAPAVADAKGVAPAIKELADDAADIRDRINHPKLRTIYPPVAQAAFALAYLAEPWSLFAWRFVCLLGEMVSLWLILELLRDTGRSPLWVAVYWWNPLVVKELINSAHMEAILVPLVLAALLLAIRQRHVAAAAMLGVASGTKVWPVILAPLILRPLLTQPWRLMLAGGVLGLLLVVFAWPPLQAGLDATSGIVAYATRWQTNSALFPALAKLIGAISGLFSTNPDLGALLARLLISALIAVVAIGLALRPIGDALDLLGRATLVVAAMVLLSPAQFPWYLIWVQPLLAVRPINGLLAATMLMPIYYASFHFHASDSYWIFRDFIVWAIWIPIWLLLAMQARMEFRGEQAIAVRPSGAADE